MSEASLPRVALVASSYLPHVGGVESHVRHVARRLHERGHPVEVWSVDRGEHLGSQVVDGVLVRYLPAPMPARSAAALASFARAAPPAWRAWHAAHRSLRPDVLHVQCFGPNGAWAQVLARRTGTPLVVSSHGETVADDHDAFGGSPLLRAALRRAVAGAAVTTGCSEAVLDDLRSRFGLVGGVVVPNGVDLGAHPAGPAGPPEPDADGAVVLGVGRLERNKGFDLLLDAFARLEATGRPPRLVLVGSGSRSGELAAQADSLGVADRLVLTGALDEAGVDAWLRRAAVVVVPSRVEAFGIVALEAWRAGAPLVATSLGGPASFVRDGTDGLVVDPRDASALAAAVGRLLDDRATAHALAEAGVQRVTEFDWERVTSAYTRLYAQLLAEVQGIWP